MNGTLQDCMLPGILLAQSAPAAAQIDSFFHVIETDAAGIPAAEGKTLFVNARGALANLSLAATAPRARQKALDAVRGCLARAVEARAVLLTISSGDDCAPDKRNEAKSFLCASLKEVCEISRRLRGPAVALQANAGSGMLIRTAADAADIADKVYPFYPAFGLALDLDELAPEENAETALKTALPYLRVVRVGMAGLDQSLKMMREASYLAPGRPNPLILKTETPAEARRCIEAAWASL